MDWTTTSINMVHSPRTGRGFRLSRIGHTGCGAAMPRRARRLAGFSPLRMRSTWADVVELQLICNVLDTRDDDEVKSASQVRFNCHGFADGRSLRPPRIWVFLILLLDQT